MSVPGYVWLVTVLGVVGLLLFDYFFHVRKAHTPTLREAAVWSARSTSGSRSGSAWACGSSAATDGRRSTSPAM